jgi:hypothetical protein
MFGGEYFLGPFTSHDSWCAFRQSYFETQGSLADFLYQRHADKLAAIFGVEAARDQRAKAVGSAIMGLKSKVDDELSEPS